MTHEHEWQQDLGVGMGCSVYSAYISARAYCTKETEETHSLAVKMFAL